MVKVREGQNMFDITVQEFGQIDNVVDVSADNDISVSDVLVTNDDLVIDSDGQGDNDIKKAIIEQGLSLNNNAVAPIINDWFSPSLDELSLMIFELYPYGLGGFVATDKYWSSSESIGAPSTFAGIITVGGGSSLVLKTQTNKVRACRTFTAVAGAYSLRDIGPAGGYIFYIDGTTYYESGLVDLSDSTWSNIVNLTVGTLNAVGEGQTNTSAIIVQAGHTSSAAKLCNDLVT